MCNDYSDQIALDALRIYPRSIWAAMTHYENMPIQI